jgi:hypothetical protein
VNDKMKYGPYTAAAAAGAIALVTLLVAAPIEAPILGGDVGLALTGAGIIAIGVVLRRQRGNLQTETREDPALAPLPRFFAEERARSSGQAIPFGRKLTEDETPSLPPMLEAHLSRQLLRRVERVCRSRRD